MADALTIRPPHCAKLGVVHCGVIRGGGVGCGGDIVVLEAATANRCSRTGIKAEQTGSDRALEHISS